MPHWIYCFYVFFFSPLILWSGLKRLSLFCRFGQKLYTQRKSFLNRKAPALASRGSGRTPIWASQRCKGNIPQRAVFGLTCGSTDGRALVPVHTFSSFSYSEEMYILKYMIRFYGHGWKKMKKDITVIILLSLLLKRGSRGWIIITLLQIQQAFEDFSLFFCNFVNIGI